MAKIFKVIHILLTLLVALIFVYIALLFAAEPFKPFIIIIAIIFFLIRLRVRFKHLVILRNFTLVMSIYIYEKLKGENKTDLIINLFLALSGIILVISMVIFLQPARKTVVSVSDTTIQEILGEIPETYINGVVDTSKEPVQIPLVVGNPIKYNAKGSEYLIYPLAAYEIAGIVAAKNTSSILGANALGPVDIGLVWGKLAETEYYRNIKFASAFRLMIPSVKGDLNLGKDYVQTHFSHNHIIPSNEEILDVVKNLSINEKVVMRGYLVEVFLNNRSIWKSSLKRDDHLLNSGAGCEVFYVTDILREI